ncbi:MFS transporter [Kitasatospora phosalacinea]|uniref:MFS transporter n=1 Tax=Kitasatospora phosalacinea TaxID=2065 RepID=A0A9W6V668_9ACTN|nr:MFS transporter [Kitasatospora phosalacinea]GLW73937.1 MFS transporter [Kitasatospora phosalacinea]
MLLRYTSVAFLARSADEGAAVATVLLALHRTGDAAPGAFVLAAWTAPHVLAAPLTGALAARTRRPRLLHAAALGGFAAALAVLAVGLGRLPLPLVLTVAALGGCCGPVVSGGLSALLTRLPPDRAHPSGRARAEGAARAQAWDAVTYNAAAVAGPGLVALLAARGSPAAATAVLVAAAGCAAVLTTLLPPVAPLDGPPSGRLRRSLGEGLRTVWRRPELRAVTAATSVAFLGLGGLTSTGVLFAARSGRESAGGLLLTAFALGALAGTLLLTRPWARVAPRRLVVVGLAGTGAGLALAVAVPVLPVAVGCFAVAGAGDGLVLTATLRIRAAYSPPHRLAQVFTLGAGLKVSAAAAGSALAGTATVHSAPRYLLGIAALQLAAALLYTAFGRPARD